MPKRPLTPTLGNRSLRCLTSYISVVVSHQERGVERRAGASVLILLDALSLVNYTGMRSVS